MVPTSQASTNSLCVLYHISYSNLVDRFGLKMSTNGGPPGGAPNGLNGLPSNHRLTTDFYDISIEGSAGDSDGVEGVAPPSRPSSPESGTTPRVLLGPRVAEATSRQDLLRSIPTAQPPFFGSITAYTHAPLPPRGGLHPGASNGASGANGHATNGLTPSSPLVSLHSAYSFHTLCSHTRLSASLVLATAFLVLNSYITSSFALSCHHRVLVLLHTQIFSGFRDSNNLEGATPNSSTFVFPPSLVFSSPGRGFVLHGGPRFPHRTIFCPGKSLYSIPPTYTIHFLSDLLCPPLSYLHTHHNSSLSNIELLISFQARSSRYLTVPGQNGSIVSTLQGLHISSCSDDMLIPTPHNTPAATPRTSPTAPGRETGRRVASNNPITPPPPTGHPRNTRTCPDSPYPGMVYGEMARIPRSPHSDTSSTDTVSGLQAPHNTPVTPSVSPQRSPTSSDGRVETPRLPRRHGPAFFGSPLNPTRQRGAGPKKKQKGKMTNGKLPNGKTKGKGKGTAKDKMLDDTALAVAHGESPIYTSNIVVSLPSNPLPSSPLIQRY